MERLAWALGDAAPMSVARLERDKVRVVPRCGRVARVKRPETVGREAIHAGAAATVAVGRDIARSKSFGGP